MADFRQTADWPPLLREFITYHQSIKNHSKKTCDEYFLDLRLFFRFLKLHRGLVAPDTQLDEIRFDDVDKDFVAQVTLSEVYAFLNYLSRQRPKHPNSRHSTLGVDAATRARKVSCLHSFFKYLTLKTHVLEENPIAGLDAPKTQKSLPKFLTLEQSQDLLNSITGQNQERDRAMIAIFLVCGLRRSEIIGLNITDWQDDTLRVLGKGNKVRMVYLNDFAIDALKAYLAVRQPKPGGERQALFLSGQSKRMHEQTVHRIVKTRLAGIGLFDYSAHKLRHSAATMMLNSGANIRVVQEVLGHEHLNTTEIYTHVTNQEIRRAAALHPLNGKDDGHGKDQEEI